MKTLLTPLAAALMLASTLPAQAQHTGHTGHAGHVMPAPKPAVTKQAPRAVAKKAAAKPAAKKPARATAARKPAARPAVEHAAMGHGAPAGASSRPVPKAAAKKPATAKTGPSAPKKVAVPAVVDHAAMGHGTPPAPAVDHAAMGHGPAPGRPASAVDHAAMGHGAPAAGASSHAVDHAAMGHTMQGMDHAAMGHGADPDLPANAAPLTPIPQVTEADRAAAFPPVHGHAAHDKGIHSFWLADRLEWQDTEEGAIGWEGLAWIGGDINRVWLRTEGEAAEGEVEHGNLEVLYGRSVTAWWDVVAGVRHDFGEGPSRTYAAIGVQGLAPYKFEVEATAYIGTSGHTAATVEAEYDTLLTNRLILQWSAEANLAGRDDPERHTGSGLTTIEAGARLRYEFSRRFAPYVGVEWERAFGETADLRREDGDAVQDTRLVAGIRFWF